MYVKEIWRYPVKSMAGERIRESELTLTGLADDRKVLVVGANGRVITARTHYRLLGLKGTIGENGERSSRVGPGTRLKVWNSSGKLRDPTPERSSMKALSASTFCRFSSRLTARSRTWVLTGAAYGPISWSAASIAWPSATGPAAVCALATL